MQIFQGSVNHDHLEQSLLFYFQKFLNNPFRCHRNSQFDRPPVSTFSASTGATAFISIPMER